MSVRHLDRLLKPTSIAVIGASDCTPRDGPPETLGVARVVIDPDKVEAEFAIVVRTDLKRRSLGNLLMGALTEFLVARGTQSVTALVLPENSAMRQWVRARGFVEEAGGSDREAVRCVLALPA